MSCEVRKQGTIAVLAPKGKLVLGAPVEEFRSAWSDALSSGCKNLVINLAEVPMVDSSGIGTLIRCHSAAVASKGRVRIVAPNEMVRNTLRVSRLHSIFQFFDDDAAAIASLQASNPASQAQ